MPKVSKIKFQRKWQDAELKVQKFKIMLNNLEKDNEVVNIQMHEMHMELLDEMNDLKEKVKELQQKAGHLEVSVILTREPALDMIAKKKFKNE